MDFQRRETGIGCAQGWAVRPPGSACKRTNGFCACRTEKGGIRVKGESST